MTSVAMRDHSTSIATIPDRVDLVGFWDFEDCLRCYNSCLDFPSDLDALSRLLFEIS